MKKVVLFAVFAFVSMTIINAQEKEKVNIDSKGAAYEATRGADPNIVQDKPSTDAPTEKPAESRGASDCWIKIVNNSGFSIDIYVDGYWKGTVSDWDYGWTTAIPGKTLLYGASVGRTVTWGPVEVDCLSEFTWTLSY
ncbi:MAG: hypothetical protein JXB49_29285 [Bacteroidales bacterium]|nr:hypothetical protein [Bacteroidales bacterium]